MDLILGWDVGVRYWIDDCVLCGVEMFFVFGVFFWIDYVYVVFEVDCGVWIFEFICVVNCVL